MRLKLDKIFSIIIFFVIVFNIFLIYLKPVKGYIFSFYIEDESFIIISIVIYASLIIYIINKNFQVNKNIYFLIIFNNLSIIFFPYISGAYLMGSGDLQTHAGMVLDIIYSGRINFNINYYPITHLLATSISLLLNLNYMYSFIIIGPLVSLFFPIFLLLLSRLLNYNSVNQKYCFLIGSTFYLSSLFQTNSITTPQNVSYFLLPIFFYIIIKNTKANASNVIISILYSIMFILIHPLTSSIIIILFSIMIIYIIFYKIKYNLYIMYAYIIFYLIINMYLITVFNYPIKYIYLYFTGNIQTLGYAVDIQSTLSKLGYSLIQTIVFIFLTFSHQLLLLILTGLFTLKILITNKKQSNFAYSFILLYMILTTILFLLQIFIPALLDISFFRFYIFIIVLTPVFITYEDISKNKTIRKLFGIFILTILFICGTLVVYSSPYNNSPNSQVSRADLYGSLFIFNNRENNVGLSGYFGQGISERMISALIPYSIFQQERYTVWEDGKQALPDHFGYNETNQKMKSFYKIERYFVINDYDMIAYNKLFTNLKRVTYEDINKIRQDESVNYLYNNGEYHIYYIGDLNG